MLNKNSINTELRNLKAGFSIAIKWGYLSKNPFRDVKIYKIKNSDEIKYLTDGQIKKIFEISLKKHGESFTNLLIFYANTGARLNEALNLIWNDVDLINKQITFRQTKAGKKRIMPMNKALFEMLSKMSLNASNKSDRVFKYKPVTVSHTFREILNEIGFEKGISVHVFRHTFASYLIMNGVDLLTLAKYMGNSVKIIEKHYVHLSKGYYHNSIKKLLF